MTELQLLGLTEIALQSVTVEPRAGSYINDVIAQMREAADHFGVPVTCDFNAGRLIIQPHDARTHDEIYGQWVASRPTG